MPSQSVGFGVLYCLTRQEDAAKDGQQVVARERCSFVLGQASLHMQQRMGPSAILQTLKASCCLPLVLVLPAMSIVPADKWRLLLFAAFPPQGFLMPEVA